MTDDDIRYVLSAYAAHAPDLDARAGLAERLARRDRARRAAVAGVACLAALVAGTGVVALTRGPDTAAVVAADDPAASATPSASDAPTASPSPSAEPPAPASPATAEPTAEPSASASASASPSAAAPQPPGPPVTDSGRGTEGLRAEIVLTPGSGPSATRMVLGVRARDDDGHPQVTRLSWGDGRAEPMAIAMPACAPPPTPQVTPRPPQPGEIENEYRYAWRHDGRYTLTVEVSSGTYCAEPPAEPERVTLTLNVVVADGVVTSNGPARPGQTHFYVGPEPEGELYSYLFEASLRDEDGWTRTATIDWGDGSPRATFGPDEPCDDGDGRHYPTGWLSPRKTHRYSPGPYTVTVTWESAGCDGGNVQRATKTVEIFVESVD